jgi:hypothetical protein
MARVVNSVQTCRAPASSDAASVHHYRMSDHRHADTDYQFCLLSRPTHKARQFRIRPHDVIFAGLAKPKNPGIVKLEATSAGQPGSRSVLCEWVAASLIVNGLLLFSSRPVLRGVVNPTCTL